MCKMCSQFIQRQKEIVVLQDNLAGRERPHAAVDNARPWVKISKYLRVVAAHAAARASRQAHAKHERTQAVAAFRFLPNHLLHFV